MSDPTFVYRVAAAMLIFIALGAWDYRRHPGNPRRLQEYLFLFAATLFAMAYGLFHDYITCSLSPQYYVLGKGINSAAKGYN